MNIHDLAGIVVQALRRSDDLRHKPWKGSTNIFAGHCYVASEVLYHMGADELGLRPAFIRHEGQPHWFLKDDDCVLDATAGQFKTNPDYKAAKHKGFLTKSPSKRARVLMQRVRELMAHDFVPQGELHEYSRCSMCGAYSDTAAGRDPCPRQQPTPRSV